ncbi:type II toxin-antitoxin system VapC family toxin [Draconibacterium sp.]|jgi:predicted nucleic acid-binding protein
MEKELILCDSNIFISWFMGNQNTIDALKNIGLKSILIPSVTVMELMQGSRNKTELADLKKKLKGYNIIHFNENTSRLAIEYIENYKLSHGLQIPDAIIAATAVSYGLKLFTYNISDFRFIPKLSLYSHP